MALKEMQETLRQELMPLYRLTTVLNVDLLRPNSRCLLNNSSNKCPFLYAINKACPSSHKQPQVYLHNSFLEDWLPSLIQDLEPHQLGLIIEECLQCLRMDMSPSLPPLIMEYPKILSMLLSGVVVLEFLMVRIFTLILEDIHISYNINNLQILQRPIPRIITVS